MKCNVCQRRVKDTTASKVKHVWKYHPEFLARLPRLMPNAELMLQRIGEFLGSKAHAALNKNH